MSYKENPFLTDKDRKKKMEYSNYRYGNEIDRIMTEQMKNNFTPSELGYENNFKAQSNSYDSNVNSKKMSYESESYINDFKKSSEDKLFSQTMAMEEDTKQKKSKNPYVRKGLHEETEIDGNSENYLDNLDNYTDYLNKQRKGSEGVNKLFNNSLDLVGYGYEKVLDKVPFLDRLTQKSGETLYGRGSSVEWDGTKKELADSGAVGNFIADSAGTLVGMKALNVNGETLLNATDRLGEKASSAVLNKIGTSKGSQIVASMARGAVDNGIGDAVLSLSSGDNPLKEGLRSATGGALLFGGGKALGQIGSKIANTLTDNLKIGDISNIDTPMIEPEKIPNIPSKIPVEAKVELPQTKIPTTDIKTPVEDARIPITEPQITPRQEVEIPTINNPKGKLNPIIEGYEPKENDISYVDRDFTNVGERKVNAMGYEHQELRPYIEAEAYALKGEFERTVKGGTGQIKDKNGTIISGTRNSRITSPDIAMLKDSTGASYEKINEAIDDVIADNGRENHALAKRIELILDDRLTNGYTEDIYGETIPKENRYIQAKEQVYKPMENVSKIPKMDVRKRITEDFNREYGNNAQTKAQTINLPNTRVNTPTEVKTSQNLNGEPINNTVRTENINNDFQKISKEEIAATNQGETNVSKMKSNTYTNSPMFEDMQEPIQSRVSGEYEVKHNADIVENARNTVDSDFEGIKNKIHEGWTKAEDVAESGMIANKLVQKSKETGDTTELIDYLRKTRTEATNAGQIVQAISTWKKLSPEGMLLKAQQIVDTVKKDLKETNPKKFKDMEVKGKLPELNNSDVKTIIDSMENITKLNDVDVNSKDFTDIVNQITDKMPPKIADSIKKLTPDKQLEKLKDIEFSNATNTIKTKIPSTLGDKIKAYQRINLLLNTSTQVRNVAGNVVMTTLENVKDVVATPIDIAASKITGQPRTTTIGSVSKQAKGFITGLRETIQDAKLGVDTSRGGGSKYFDEQIGFLKDGNVRQQAFRKIDNPKNVKDLINNVLSGSEKLTNTVLELGDRPFFEAAFENSIYKQLKANKIETPTEKMIEQAMLEAENITFQNASILVDGFRSIQKGLNLGKDTGLGTVVIPFIKTPANILDKAVDYSPLGGARGVANIIKAFITGKADQKRIVDQLSRALTGTSLIALGYTMQKKGVLRGSGSTDKDVRALENQTGKMSYSIRTGNTYNTIDWMQPAAIPLMIGADIAQNGKSNQEKDKIIMDAIKSGGSTLLNQSLLTGLSSLFGGFGYDSGSNFMDGVEKASYNALSQAVPFNSALRQTTNLTDKNTRVSQDKTISPLKNEINKINAKIPWKSKNLPKKYDTVGNEVMKNNGSKGVKYFFDTFINPGKTAKYNPTSAEKIALDIYNNSGETIQIPRVVKDTISYKESKDSGRTTITLNSKEKSEYQRIVGEKTEEAFVKMSKSHNFKNMTDFEKAQELQDIMTEIDAEAKEEMLDMKNIKYYRK